MENIYGGIPLSYSSQGQYQSQLNSYQQNNSQNYFQYNLQENQTKKNFYQENNEFNNFEQTPEQIFNNKKEERTLSMDIFNLVNQFRSQRNQPILIFNEKVYYDALQNSFEDNFTEQEENFKKIYQKYQFREIYYESSFPLYQQQQKQQLVDYLQQWLQDYFSDLLDCGLAIVSIQEQFGIRYHLTYIQAKIFKEIQNFQNEQKEIGLEILKEFNLYRQSNNLNPLQWSEQAYQRAMKHTIYQAQKLEISHDFLEERTDGYTKANENVAYFTNYDPLPKEIVAKRFMQQWINSPSHNKNLLDTELTHSGIAVYALQKDNLFWYFSSQLNTNEDTQMVYFQKIMNRTKNDILETFELKELSYKIFLKINFVRTQQQFKEIQWNEQIYQQASQRSIRMGQQNQIIEEQIDNIQNCFFQIEKKLTQDEIFDNLFSQISKNENQKTNLSNPQINHGAISIFEFSNGTIYSYYMTLILAGNPMQLFQLIFCIKFFIMLKKINFTFSKIMTAQQAIEKIKPGMTILSGGFGLCGIPITLHRKISQSSNIKDLTIVSNNIGTDNEGLGLLLQNNQIKRMISSYVGENKTFEKKYFSGEIELEITPQGTLAEKIRAGGAGIPLFATPTGVGTILESGGFIIKNGNEQILMEKRQTWKDSQGKKFLLEKSIKGDVAIIKAKTADKSGNLIYNKTARNFNQDMAKSATFTIAEVEEIVETGEINPDHVHTPGIYVDAIVLRETNDKPIEKKTNNKNTGYSEDLLNNEKFSTRVKIAKRAAQEIQDGMFINLGIGIPTLVPIFINPEYKVVMQGENGMLGLNGYPDEGQEDPDLIDPAKQTIIASQDASYFSSSESFAMIRGGHLDWTLLGAMEVDQQGDLANWIIPGKIVKGMGGAMDLVGSGSKVMVLMEHCVKGKSKILQKCKLPLTGQKCIDRIITEFAVFEYNDNGLILSEIADGQNIDSIHSMTDAKFEVSKNLKFF